MTSTCIRSHTIQFLPRGKQHSKFNLFPTEVLQMTYHKASPPIPNDHVCSHSLNTQHTDTSNYISFIVYLTLIASVVSGTDYTVTVTISTTMYQYFSNSHRL